MSSKLKWGIGIFVFFFLVFFLLLGGYAVYDLESNPGNIHDYKDWFPFLGRFDFPPFKHEGILSPSATYEDLQEVKSHIFWLSALLSLILTLLIYFRDRIKKAILGIKLIEIKDEDKS